jgi:hypothetical protein
MFEHGRLGGISDNDHPLGRVCIIGSKRLVALATLGFQPLDFRTQGGGLIIVVSGSATLALAVATSGPPYRSSQT